QTLVRQGICALLALSDRIDVVGQAVNGREVLDAIAQDDPDVLLLDIRMPVMDGIETLQQMMRVGSLVPTIILTTFDDDACVLQAMRNGARGFLLKGVSLESLVDAIIC